MQKTVLTDEGYQILNSSRSECNTQYWIGYFGLAYVPENSELPATVHSLTDGAVSGDIIYNVFQGSMTTVHAGTNTQIDTDSPAYKLANECMYSGNVLSRFRYVLDENDNNQLILFADNKDMGDDKPEHPEGLVEYKVFRNDKIAASGDDTSDVEATPLPLPAPLYFGGDPVNYSQLTGTVDPEGVQVTHDTRSYSSSIHALNQGYDEGRPGLNGSTPADADKYDYVASKGNTYSDVATNTNDAVLEQEWQLQSVSNFNRYHAPTNAEGYRQDAEPSCRNMAKVTKYFPINHYDVINTCDSDPNKVATVKYTVLVDVKDIFTDVSKRSTKYYRIEDDQFVDAKESDYKVGFKFNRIGIYAVEATLHAYNTEEDAQQDCVNHHLQMQIVGEAEPKLVAVMELPTAIVLSEDGPVQQYSFDFTFNFVKPDTTMINDAVVYYNLYEDDAITWYKNQLIANASTADAVTSLGVQMAYLRQQINQYTGAGTSSCGIVDEDNYASNGSTYPYMKNIVDSIKNGNGAVRGIDTSGEDESIKIYQTNGKKIVEDEEGVPHYEGEPDSVVPLLIDSDISYVGDESMNLGKDSSTLGTRSINMSNYGMLGAPSTSTLLMGGIGKNNIDKYDDGHLAVNDAAYSIINVRDGEIKYMRGSMWLNADSSVWVDGTVYDAIGVGHNDVLEYDGKRENLQVVGSPTHGSLLMSMLIGRNAVYTQAEEALIIGTSPSGSLQSVGLYDAFNDLNASYMQWDNAESQTDLEEMIFESTNGDVRSVISVGSHNNVGRRTYNILSVGHNDDIPTNSTNSILIGDHINRSDAAFKPKIVLTLDEFNERYGEHADYPADDPIYDCNSNSDIVVVGTGTLKARNGQGEGTLVQRDVKGVTMYIRYSNATWSLGMTVGDDTLDSGYFGNRAYNYANLYSTSGNLKNMFMLGDYMDAGHGSSSSILIGDYTGSRKLSFKDSFMNFMGDDITYRKDQTLGPCLEMENVWWIGSARTREPATNLPAGYEYPNDFHGDGSMEWGKYNPETGEVEWSINDNTGHLVAATFSSEYSNADKHNGVYKDAFVFRGNNPSVYAHAHWYGVRSENTKFAHVTNTEEYSWDSNTLWQSVQSPMIYTGGIALGGYGMNNCNFMLMKIGTSTMNTTNAPSATGINMQPNIALENDVISSFSEIRRSSNPHGPWTEQGSKMYVRRTVSGVIPTSSGTTITLSIPVDEEIDETKEFSIYAYYFVNHQIAVNATFVRRDTYTVDCTIDHTYAHDVTVRVSYDSYKPNGRILYNVHSESEFDGKPCVIDHFMVDSPYAGMVLMVQDKQELDGTLHVGLGKVSGSGVGANLIDIGYIYHDDTYIDHNVRYPDPDIDNNPMSDEFIERIDEMLASGGVPFIMYRCDQYSHAPTAQSWGTETGEDTPDIDPDISETDTMTRFAPLVKIGYCSYYFANPIDAGYVIRLKIGQPIKFLKNTSSDTWHSYTIE